MAEEFNVGDVVELKSGGPEMTVSKPAYNTQPDEVDCQWFGGRKLEHGKFPKASLVHVKADD